jgi:hypothetical protein
VRETFGAMTAVIQAHQAPNAQLRSIMASIARDETRHARLAWEIDVWARAALAPGDRRRLDEARRAEGAKLVAELAYRGVSPTVASTLGFRPQAPHYYRHAGSITRSGSPEEKPQQARTRDRKLPCTHGAATAHQALPLDRSS